jgi:MFS family permease
VIHFLLTRCCSRYSRYLVCPDLFAYISAAFISDRFHTGVAKAGWLAGLSNGIAVLVCPIAGVVMDYVGYKMWTQVAAGVATTCAYMLLLSATVTPVPSLVLLAICVSFTPTILRSSVPNLVAPAVYGCAYGIYESMESVGSVAGNALVGYLRDTTHSWDMDLEIFAGMGFVATALTLLLIGLDKMGWIGVAGGGTPALGGGFAARAGSLNQSSFATGLEYDRLQRSKDRFLQKQNRWREEERQLEEEARQEASIAHIESGKLLSPSAHATHQTQRQQDEMAAV